MFNLHLNKAFGGVLLRYKRVLPGFKWRRYTALLFYNGSALFRFVAHGVKLSCAGQILFTAFELGL